jgi:alkylated DNA repair dioxygenase AlkB
MKTLFPIHVDASDVPAIPGLRYVPEFVTEAEEAALARAIDAAPWDTAWDRRRQPYGAAYDRQAGETPAIPAWGQALAERLLRGGITDRPFDQMLVNEYLPGQGIALHRDYDPFDRTVVSLSLLAPCVMDFRHAPDGRRESLLLERRSLLVLSDEAPYEWQHGIARRKSDRWQGLRLPRARRLSVTFRLLKQQPAAAHDRLVRVGAAGPSRARSLPGKGFHAEAQGRRDSSG